MILLAAINFFHKFSQDQEWYYQDYIAQLATVTKAEHMAGNQLLDNFKYLDSVLRVQILLQLVYDSEAASLPFECQGTRTII